MTNHRRTFACSWMRTAVVIAPVGFLVGAFPGLVDLVEQGYLAANLNWLALEGLSHSFGRGLVGMELAVLVSLGVALLGARWGHGETVSFLTRGVLGSAVVSV